MSDEVTKLTSGDPAVPTTQQAPPRRGRFFARRKAQRSSLTHCENCGTELRGHYCPHCGQPAIDYRRSFRHVLVDLLDQFLNWDSKFFKTIALILIQPWNLTNEFLAGHRVRYVHPLRLYLLASILFFFAVSYWAKAIHVTPNRFSPQQRAAIEAKLKNKNLPPEVRAEVENALRSEKEQAKQSAPGTPTPKETATPTVANVDFSSSETPQTAFEKWIETRAKEKMGEHGTNMQLFIRTLISNLPYMMLCCIPLFAFVLKVLYVRRHIFYIDHLIYALHIHTFAYTGIMLIVLATVGLNRVASAPTASRIIAFLWIAFVVQIFLSVRRVYRQRWFISVFKFFFGGLAYLIVLGVALAATFFVTLALPG
jgi:uncharacterized membrane protein/ribosomal protein L32